MPATYIGQAGRPIEHGPAVPQYDKLCTWVLAAGNLALEDGDQVAAGTASMPAHSGETS